jgi:outer membrane protein assembly factor BamA
LGGPSNIHNEYSIDFNYLKIHQTLLRKIYPNLFAGLGFFYDYFWDVQEIDPPKGVVTDFERYGLNKTVKASGLAFRLLLDTRKNQINPDAGWYVNIVDRPNFTFMGSDNNWQSLLIEARRYINFPGHSKNVLAFWSYNWLTVEGKPPYLLLPSTGWDDFYNTGRGYIQGRYRGRNMIYLETEYRFGITQNGLLGAVVFVNAESFSGELSKEFQVIAPGGGAGIRIRLNKYSGANLCVDYGFGLDGSHGISVNLGEVF